MNSPVVLERHDRVAVVTLNRPEAGNALNGPLYSELSDALTELEKDDAIRAMVLTGAGKVFCAGADVNDAFFRDATRPDRVERARLAYGVMRQLHAAPFPHVAAVNGAAVASGVCLAALCDVRLASTAARFSLGFARVGAFPDMAGAVVLPRLLGTARAIELTVLDEPVDAARALELGLVTRLVEPDQLMDAAIQLAARLADQSPLAVRLTRQAMTDLPAMPFDAALDVEAAMVVDHAESFDLHEGIAAVRERRSPEFRGR